MERIECTCTRYTKRSQALRQSHDPKCPAKGKKQPCGKCGRDAYIRIAVPSTDPCRICVSSEAWQYRIEAHDRYLQGKKEAYYAKDQERL